MGQIVNTNAQFIAQKLREAGISCYHQTVVGDNEGRLLDALEFAASRSDIVITTGGLGPTADDLTKETIAKFCGVDCVLDEESLQCIKDRFSQMGRCMAQNNVKQAEMPQGCMILKNNNGTAPGAILEYNGTYFIMLPGPPFEMKGMFNDYVADFLRGKTGGGIFSKTLRIFGIGESDLEIKIANVMQNQTNPTVAMYAKIGEVTLRLAANAATQEEADKLIAPVEAEIRNTLGDMVYGEGEENSLHNVVVGMLRGRGLKLATAESCTGGLVAEKITEIPGASEVFDMGVVAYSNAQKEKLLGVPADTLAKFGAVSEEVALEMCKGAARLSGADIAVSVTGIAGPDGGSAEKPVGLVHIGICAGDFAECRRHTFTGSREIVRQRAAMNALDMVRKIIENLY